MTAGLGRQLRLCQKPLTVEGCLKPRVPGRDAGPVRKHRLGSRKWVSPDGPVRHHPWCQTVRGLALRCPRFSCPHLPHLETARSQRRLLQVGQSLGKLCNTSPGLSRRAHLLEECSPGGDGLQSGTQQPSPPPCTRDGAPRGLCGLLLAVFVPTPSASWQLPGACRARSSPSWQPPPPVQQGGTLGFVGVFY